MAAEPIGIADERLYDVHVAVHQVYRGVLATSPEQAAALVEAEYLGTPETVDVDIERVTGPGDDDADDLRAPWRCEAHNRTIPAATDYCRDCLYASLGIGAAR